MGKSGASNRRRGGKGAAHAAGSFRKKRIVVTVIVAAAVLAIGVPLVASAVSGGLAVPFASASTATVTFNTGDGGSAVDSQTVASGGHAVKPATSPTRSGYVFAGWFESSDGGATLSGMPWDFTYSPVSGDLKLYAKWLAVQAKKEVYFMATAALTNDVLSKLYGGTATDEEKSDNNFRSASDIAADMKVLHGTADANNQGEGKAAVTSRWEGYMDSDTGGSSYSHDSWTSSTVHLYTRWNGDAKTASDEDGWVELRVVEVGAHLNTAGDETSADGSAVTFMAVHSLYKCEGMNGTSKSDATNSGGWEKSEMRTDCMQNYVLVNLDEGFKSALKTVKKETVNDETVSTSSTATETDDSVWLMSYKELMGTTQTWTGDEGEQYAWFTGKVTSLTGSNAAIANLYYVRSGRHTGQSGVWLRSPRLNYPYGFMHVTAIGALSYSSDTSFPYAVCPALSM